MTITLGKIHKYLGITIDYSSTGKVKLYTVDYIGNMLYDISEVMKGYSETLAAHHLFYISQYSTKLSRTDAGLFRHFLLQLLYPPKRSLPDIQLAVSFFCIIVIEPDVDD